MAYVIYKTTGATPSGSELLKATENDDMMQMMVHSSMMDDFQYREEFDLAHSNTG